MQLQFLAPIELFFKAVELLQFLTRVELLFFYDLQFSRCAVCHVYTFVMKGTFNHFWKVRGLEQHGTCFQAEKCCVSFCLFSFSVSVSVCCVCLCVCLTCVVCVCVCVTCFSLCLEQAQWK